MSHFSTALIAAMEEAKINGCTLAERVNTAPSTISRILKDIQQPRPELLRSLCGDTWSNPDTGLEILRGWLLDEIERVGRAPGEVGIEIYGNDPGLRSLQKDLGDVFEWLMGAKEGGVEAVIAQMAEAARMEQKAKRDKFTQALAAAEEQKQFGKLAKKTPPPGRKGNGTDGE